MTAAESEYRNCPNCDARVREDEPYCPKCSHELEFYYEDDDDEDDDSLPELSPSMFNKSHWLVIAIVLFFVGLFLWPYVGHFFQR